jgi:hypothetical protein
LWSFLQRPDSCLSELRKVDRLAAGPPVRALPTLHVNFVSEHLCRLAKVIGSLRSSVSPKAIEVGAVREAERGLGEQAGAQSG